MSPTVRVSEEEYAEWEREVIARFFSPPLPSQQAPATATMHLPRAGEAVHAVKRKAVVVADVVLAGGFKTASEVVASPKARPPDLLPPKRPVRLNHAGLGRRDAVSVGWDEGKGVWYHPATDTGGLTNVRQAGGKKADFLPTAAGGCDVGVGQGDSRPETTEAIRRVFNALKAASEKSRLQGPVRRNIAEWVRSLRALWTSKESPFVGARLRVSVLPPEHRVLVKAKTVYKETGRYYVRSFGGKWYARSASPDFLYTAVTDRYITPNITEENIKNEYVPYTAGRRGKRA